MEELTAVKPAPKSSHAWDIAAIVLFGSLVHTFAAFACRVWVTPDSGEYIRLAGGILEKFDFSDELFVFRMPGYPLLLAAVFRLFGPNSVIALPVLQHAMIVLCSVLLSRIAWLLRPSRSVAILIGFACALSPALTGYAGAILAEIPYVLLLLYAVWSAMKYDESTRMIWLTTASLALGIAVMFKPGAQIIIPILIGFSWIRNRRNAGFVQATPIRSSKVKRPRNRAFTGLRTLAVATIPAAAIILPWLVLKAQLHDRFDLTCQDELLWYYRPACVDQRTSERGPAFQKAARAVEEAKRRGWTDPSVTTHHLWPTVHACQRVYSLSLGDAADLLADAGKELILQNLTDTLRRTARYSAAILFTPDFSHRMVPGGKRGEHGTLARNAVLYSVDSFLPNLSASRTAPLLDRFLPIRNEQTRASVYWSKWIRWYVEYAERGAPFPGMSITPYEAWTAAACMGALLSLVLKNRGRWAFLVAVVLCHVVAPAFFAGPAPRTIAPVKPLLILFSFVPAMLLLDAARRFRERFRARPFSLPIDEVASLHP